MAHHILIIEDEEVPRILIEKNIQKLNKNLKVTSVQSVAEGLFYFFNNHYDLIFLDIMMPKVDGNDFLYIIETNLDKGHIKNTPNIVVQSAIQSIQELSAFTSKECVQEVLRKPLTPQQIESCVERYCL